MNCPICYSSNIVKDYFQIAISNNIDRKISFCLSCNLYFCSNIPSQVKIKDYYNQKYSTRNNNLIKNILKYIFRYYRSYSQYKYVLDQTIPDYQYVLEVGTGDGMLLHLWKKHNCYVNGTEYNDNELQYASHKYGIEINNIEINDITRKYDLILMSHILEHFSNLREVLRHSARILNTHGCVFIEVPHSPLMPSDCDQQDLQDYLSTSHIYNFRPNNLQLLFKQEGFKIICIDRLFYNIPLHPGEKVKKSIGKLFIQALRPDFKTAAYSISYILANLTKRHKPFIVLSSLDLPWQGQGDSIRLIAQKTANHKSC